MYIANLFKHWTYRLFAPGTLLREKYEAFRRLLEHDKRSHELIAELQQIFHDRKAVDFSTVEAIYSELSSHVSNLVECLIKLHPRRYVGLSEYFQKIDFYVKLALSSLDYSFSPPFVLGIGDITPDMRPRVGGKALGLSVARNVLHLVAPDGFVVTCSAFNYFVEANDLRAEIDKRLSRLDMESYSSLEEISRELMDIVRQAPIPEPIETEILSAVSALQAAGQDTPRFSVRSSAVSEDGSSSYAGQYKTVLNVPAENVVAAYRDVIASKYLARAIFYRIIQGDVDREAPMAVLVLPMVDAKASGIVYTRDPADQDADSLVVYSVWGPSKVLVDGTAAPGIIRASRHSPHRPQRQDGPKQTLMAVPAANGGFHIGPCDSALPPSFALSDPLLVRLIEWALRLEEHYGFPLDIEWCVDHRDRLFIMQSRALKMESPVERPVERRSRPIENPVVLSGGTRACGGMATGFVYNVETERELQRFPADAILVIRDAAPEYVTAMGKAAAVVSDRGGAAGHLAAIAREFRVPALFDTGSATRLLATGQLVTVCADTRTVYAGRVDAAAAVPRPFRTLSRLEESPLDKKLQKALQHIVPLNLLDPQAESFAPQGCRTFHDILRYCHEKGVEEMFSLGSGSSRNARGAKRLISELPIVVYLLDLGGGFHEGHAAESDIHVNAVHCIPFRALWKGLSHPGIQWNRHVMHFDWKEFDRLSRGFVRTDSIQLGSYGILSRDYLNFHMHFGYHFVIVDTLCTGEPENNYLMLRFAGGGAGPASRILRVRFLEDVLREMDFKVEVRGDLMDAQLSRRSRERLEEMLELVGGLLGCTRLLDMALKDESQARDMARRFLEGERDLSPLTREPSGPES